MRKHGDYWNDTTSLKLMSFLLDDDKMSCDDVDRLVAIAYEHGLGLYHALRVFYGDV